MTSEEIKEIIERAKSLGNHAKLVIKRAKGERHTSITIEAGAVCDLTDSIFDLAVECETRRIGWEDHVEDNTKLHMALEAERAKVAELKVENKVLHRRLNQISKLLQDNIFDTVTPQLEAALTTIAAIADGFDD